ncbi:hypothetical protein GIB67_008485, partial [Kingdonia uniflora]
MKGGGRRIFRHSTNSQKDRDEDLLLFCDMHKRDNQHIVSLLQPVSDEFEPTNGNLALYRIASAKKGFGVDLFNENDKNDYNWLKTPPATPLFQSLEMEANAPELAVQRELPVLQPLTRFAGTTEASKLNSRSKSPNPKPKIPTRSITPSTRPSVTPNKRPTTPSSDTTKPLKALQKQSNITTKRPTTPSSIMYTLKPTTTPTTTVTIPRESLSVKETITRPQSRSEVSPMVRSRIPATILGFTDETPANLKTDRANSVTRGRPKTPNNPTVQPKQEPVKSRRQSCSPSISRGRKMEVKVEETKGKIQAGNGSLAFGSSMVEKVMNARKSVTLSGGAEERALKVKTAGGSSAIENHGYGRMMSKSALDMALKHMEIKRDPINYRQANPVKNFPTTNSTNESKPNIANQVVGEGRTQESWKRKE